MTVDKAFLSRMLAGSGSALCTREKRTPCVKVKACDCIDYVGD